MTPALSFHFTEEQLVKTKMQDISEKSMLLCAIPIHWIEFLIFSCECGQYGIIEVFILILHAIKPSIHNPWLRFICILALIDFCSSMGCKVGARQPYDERKMTL